METNNETRVWADGHGRWHAEVPDTPEARETAITLITRELTARYGDPATSGFLPAYVAENITPEPCETPGRVHFAEYAID